MLTFFNSKNKAAAKDSKETTLPKQPLVSVYDERAFWVHNGPVLHNLRELYDAFATISAAQFEHHTTLGRHDFAAWIGGVFGDAFCAEELGLATTRKQGRDVLRKHLKRYKE